MINTRLDTGKMVRMAVLVAIIAIMSFTPIGFVPIGPVTVTLVIIPVAVAAVVVGPVGGAIAGGVWGFCAFLRILFGLSTPLFVYFLSNYPILTLILMLIPRILAGWIAGLASHAVLKLGNKTFAAMAGSLTVPVCNTIFFVGTWILLFGRTDAFVDVFGATVWGAIVAIISVNALIEAVFGLLTGTAVSRAMVYFIPDKSDETRSTAI